MEELLGKWRLLKNERFDDFLKFTQIPWYQRKVAGYCGIDLEITSKGLGKYEKRVNSTFYKTIEEINFNDNYIASGTTLKKYSYEEDGSVSVDIKGSIVHWRERIFYKHPNLVVEYSWIENDKCKSARQVFKP